MATGAGQITMYKPKNYPVEEWFCSFCDAWFVPEEDVTEPPCVFCGKTDGVMDADDERETRKWRREWWLLEETGGY